MELWITIFVLSFAPGIFWLWFFYRKDTMKLEPLYLVALTFFMGMLATIPAYFANNWIYSKQGIVFLAIFGAPIVEEICKFLAVRLTVYRLWEFDEPMDGIVYAAAAALGFASVENILYIFGSYQEAGLGGAAEVSMARALLAVPGHVLDSSVWGYCLGRAKSVSMSDRTEERKLILAGLLGAMVLHGTYNFLLVAGAILFLGWFLTLLFPIFVRFTWRITNELTDTALADSPYNPLNTSSAKYRPKFFALLKNQSSPIDWAVLKLLPEAQVIAPDNNDFNKLTERFSSETRATQIRPMLSLNHRGVTDDSLTLVPLIFSKPGEKLYISGGAPTHLTMVLQKLNPALAFLGLIQQANIVTPATLESGWHRSKTRLQIALYDDRDDIIRLFTIPKKRVRAICEETLRQMILENIRRGLAKAATNLELSGKPYTPGYREMPDHKIILASVVLLNIAAALADDRAQKHSPNKQSMTT